MQNMQWEIRFRRLSKFMVTTEKMSYQLTGNSNGKRPVL